MRKVFTIAAREYKAMVGTKAFLASIIMMPVLMLGSLLALELLQNSNEIKDRKIAIIDHSESFSDAIQTAADQRLAQIDAMVASGAEQPKVQLGRFSKDRYLIEWIKPTDKPAAELRLELSNRVRNQELYAFMEIPKSVLDGIGAAKERKTKGQDAPPNLSSESVADEPEGAGSEGSDLAGAGMESPMEGALVLTEDGASASRVRFYAQDSSLSDARVWLAALINADLQRRRLEAAEIDPVVVAIASQSVDVVGMGLAEKSSDGSIASQEENDPMRAIFLPMGVMMLMFMVIFMAAQPMLESVLEEKSQRIAEVLLGSANSFQLMLGKLFGTVAGSLTVFAIYLIGMYGFASYKGFTDQIPFELTPWFILFQVMGVLFYASIFLAIGASVSQLKEAQSMLLPVWMMMMSPMFVWLVLVRDPLGSTAFYFSMFPPAAPTAMMLRMATGQAIPVWQPILVAVLTGISTLFVVYIAARIFRVGILWQGKTPKLSEIAKWIFRG